MNLRAADDFKQVVGYTGKLLVPEFSALNLVVIENVNKYEESVTDVILVEVIEAGISAVCSEMHKLFITLRIRKNYLKSGNQLLCQFVSKTMMMMMMMMMMLIQIAVIIEVSDLITCVQYFIQNTILSAFVKYFRKNGT